MAAGEGFSEASDGVRVMYTSHFGLTEAPFSITPDPRYLYMSDRHREGLAHLLYGIREQGGFVQLTGEVGTGKTTLCRCLLAQLPPGVDVALILNPRLTTIEFLETVCDELRIAHAAEAKSVKVLVDALYGYLLDAHRRGRRTALIIDEAQNLPADVLEQIRLLTNLETDISKLLQIILIGQPELIRLLEQQKLRQLAQRITARYHLLQFSQSDTCAYIRHRVRVAGGSDGLFTPAAMRQVHRRAGGIPRLINVICDRSLLGAYAHDQPRVDAATVQRAAREVQGAVPRERLQRRLAWAFRLGVLGVAAAGVAILVAPGQISLIRDDGAQPVVTADTSPMRVAKAPGEGRQTGDGGRVGPLTQRKPVAAGPTDARFPTPPQLAELLADPSIRGDADAAFASVYSRWRLEHPETGTRLGCERKRSAGLRCLLKVGSWNRLRRFDVPAILELGTPDGERHRVALVGLAEESATLELSGQEYTFPLSEVDRLWDGPFILLWKAPPVGSRPISPGMRGEDVEWLWRRLDELDGKPPESRPHDVYDEALKQRVQTFQRRWSLVPDGIVGEETLAQLTLAARDPRTPSLLRRAP